MPDLTEASAAEYDHILHGHMTPTVAAQYLREGKIELRTFGDVLKDVYPEADLFEKLVKFFSEDCDDPNPASTQRKIRNWIADRHPPQNREDIFKIAFALGLNEPRLNFLLGICDDYGVHYRDGRELVLAWFLKNGKSYRAALDFYSTLPECETLEQADSDDVSRLTNELHCSLARISNEEELRGFYIKNLNNFGRLHLRAYYFFDSFLNQLIHPNPQWSDAQEENYSVEQVMNVYLSMHMPSGKKRDNYTLIQKLIKRNWPNATSIKNIRAHKEDVSRKLLLLLYVATENEGINGDDYDDYYDESLTFEQRFEDHWWTINAMLNDCGMVPLDPRNAFDWLILYAVSGDEETAMSDRLEQVITYMFSDIIEAREKEKSEKPPKQ